jgi:hypothetical protein
VGSLRLFARVPKKQTHTYRNTIASSPLGKRIFKKNKNKAHLSKIEILKFCCFSKKNLVKMTLNNLEITKCCKN